MTTIPVHLSHMWYLAYPRKRSSNRLSGWSYVDELFLSRPLAVVRPTSNGLPNSPSPHFDLLTLQVPFRIIFVCLRVDSRINLSMFVPAVFLGRPDGTFAVTYVWALCPGRSRCTKNAPWRTGHPGAALMLCSASRGNALLLCLVKEILGSTHHLDSQGRQARMLAVGK